MSGYLGAFPFLLIVAAPGTGIGEPVEPRAAARAEVARGAALYAEGAHQQALDHFLAAYALYPSPKIYFNIGQARRGLAQSALAIEAFETFLAEDDGADQGGLRPLARRYLDELRPEVDSVELACDVEGARVVVDGRAVGTTPLPWALPLAPGDHVIRVDKPGLGAKLYPFEAARGRRSGLQARLMPVAPRPAAPARAMAAAPARLTAPAEVAAPAPPLYRRWWFWTVLAATAVAATAVGVVAGRSSPQAPASGLGTHHLSF